MTTPRLLGFDDYSTVQTMHPSKNIYKQAISHEERPVTSIHKFHRNIYTQKHSIGPIQLINTTSHKLCYSIFCIINAPKIISISIYCRVASTGNNIMYISSAYFIQRICSMQTHLQLTNSTKIFFNPSTFLIQNTKAVAMCLSLDAEIVNVTAFVIHCCRILQYYYWVIYNMSHGNTKHKIWVNIVP